MRPMAGVRLTLISRQAETPYSGMLPGVIAGHYTRGEAHIDLRPLARFAGARTIVDEAVGLDPRARQVLFATRPPIGFDVLSINVGSTPDVSVPGAEGAVTPVKPIDRLLERWRAVEARLLASDSPCTVAVVGGGAGGVELLLAIEWRVRHQLAAAGRGAGHIRYGLFTDSAHVLPTHHARVRRAFARTLAERGITVHAGSAVVKVEPGCLHTADGRSHRVDEVFWTTQARAAAWLRDSGLSVDDRGFVRVGDTLESVSHPGIFAAGDVAAVDPHPRPKSGVFAVRQGRPLTENLRAALAGRARRGFRPQRRFLSLISTGDQHAVASRGPFALEGRWVWRWKDRIDRAFMRQYTELPPMRAAAPDAAPADEMAAPGQVPDASMRCGGCGSKVGASVLDRVLTRVKQPAAGRVVIGLDAADDAAVAEVPPGRLLVQTVDFFRELVSDPWVFGQIAASHALGDLHAMGARPATALAIVTVPYGIESKMEETLTHLLAGAVAVFDREGVVLAGGHTSEGAELALGFAVSGDVAPDGVLRKGGLRPGDCLILTKPLGTGTLFAADMRGRARGRWIDEAVASMLLSNGPAAAAFIAHGVSACTDVTGFGLAGHALEMARASGVGVELDLSALPLLPGADETLRQGLVSSLHSQNARAADAIANAARHAGDLRFAALFDPQTAGGLLAGVSCAGAEGCVAQLRAAGYPSAAIVGRVTPGEDGERWRLKIGD